MFIYKSEYRSRRGKILDKNHNKTLDEILNEKKNECGLHFLKNECVNKKNKFFLQDSGRKNSPIMTLEECKNYADINNLEFDDKYQTDKISENLCIPNKDYPIGCIKIIGTKTKVYYNYNGKHFTDGICKKTQQNFIDLKKTGEDINLGKSLNTISKKRNVIVIEYVLTKQKRVHYHQKRKNALRINIV